MSTSAREGPGVPVEKKGLSKYMSRMKTVLKRGDGSKRLSFSGKSPVVASASTEPKPAVASTQETKEEAKIPEGPQPVKVMRSQIAAERARKLGERFALTIEPLAIDQDKEAFRIEKPIRMRIHRSCHKCDTTFGGNKVCTTCEHVRCKACPKYPVKNAEGKRKGKEIAAVIVPGGIEVDTYYGLREHLMLTKPNPRAGGQPLVRKKPKQRVRRNCHECSTLFAPGVKICTGCEHVRCADCPRDPAKKDKYPNGYPGDAPSSNTSRPVNYSCHKCNKVYPSVPHPSSPEGIALKGSGAEPVNCTRCSHPMCQDCPRAPPQKVEPAPDPEVWKSIQAKLAALNVRTGEEKEA